MTDSETWHSPTAKSRLRVVERSPERLTVEFENEPGDIGPPEHFHPAQEERFTVLEGELRLMVGGREVPLKAGESHLVPRGTPHTFHNAGTTAVRFTSAHMPPLGFERFIKTIYDLDRDGRANEKGQPGFFQTMVLLKAHPGEQLLAGPPPLVQRALFSVMGALGELVGYAAEYTSHERRG